MIRKFFLSVLLIFINSFSFGFSNQGQLFKTPLNTLHDEFPCFRLNNKVIILQKPPNESPRLFKVDLNNPLFTESFPSPKTYLKFNGTFITFFSDSTFEFYIFSGKSKKKYDSDIFILKREIKTGKEELIPYPFNSNKFESHPHISKDGEILLFSTDMKEDGKETDIAISIFGNGKWSSPKILENVNSNLNEITPYLDKNGNLYFARYDTNNYNIYKAELLERWKWGIPRRLPYPINTESNEISPIVVDDKLFFASDRPESSGGFDIFYYDLCLPVVLELNFTQSTNIFSSFDKIVISDTFNNIIDEKFLGTNSSLLFNLKPNKVYNIKIYNECSGQNIYQKTIETPCIDTLVVKFKISLNITNNLTEEINLPFFVSGYYKPITSKNLNQLKMLFDYNLIGLDDSTNYIENPKNKYDNLAPHIEESINKIVAKISQYINLFEKGCIEPKKRLKIQITGFADPRQISSKAKYFEESIQDDKFNLFVERGVTMNNLLLSRLRAYHTGKLIYELLKKEFSTQTLNNFLVWEIIGGGVAKDTEEDYLVLRMVKIKIEISENY